MRDISYKISTLRTATAEAFVLCSLETLERIENNTVPKGNIFEYARAAAFLGAKKTPELIPHCHPVSIDGLEISFETFRDAEKATQGVKILGTAKSIGRTGIEIEILTAVTVAALTLYDTLKPIDKNLEITNIKLLEKKGGKTDRLKNLLEPTPQCAVLVCSDSVFAGINSDRSGEVLKEMLEQSGAQVIDFKICSDDAEGIEKILKNWIDSGIEYIFTTGGTGISPRDNTVGVVEKIIDYKIEGISEAMRSYGQSRLPLAMFSRAVAGVAKKTVIITLPGSVGGVRDGLNSILPHVFHARKIILGGGH